MSSRRADRVVFGALAIGLILAGFGSHGSIGSAVEPASSTAAPPLFTSDPDHSSLSFVVRHLKLTKVRGIFHRWRAALSYDSEDVRRSSVTVVVDIGSLDTGNASRDRDLRSDHFFDVDRFPVAVFQSTAVRKTADGFVAEGMLRIRDVTRRVEIPFVHTGSFVSPSGRSLREGFEGAITIRRADYGVVHEGNILEVTGAIGRDVTIEIELSAIRLHWAAFPFREPHGDSTLGERLLRTATSEGQEAAVARLRAFVAADSTRPASSVQDMATLGGRLTDAGHPEVAAALLAAYAISDSANADAQLAAADAFLSADSATEALTFYRRTLRLAPTRAEAAERVRVLTGHSDRATLIEAMQ